MTNKIRLSTAAKDYAETYMAFEKRLI